MRNAEVLVVSTSQKILNETFQSICSEIINENKDVIFGFIPIDDQLQLNLYGFFWKENSTDYYWERICRKVLGAIVLFDWQNETSLSMLKEVLSFFEKRFEIPIMTASTLNGAITSLPIKLYRGGLPVSEGSRFTFFDLKAPSSVRELIVGLININLETMSKE